MINFILFILATIGLTQIIVDSSIFQPVRDFFSDVKKVKLELEVEKITLFKVSLAQILPMKFFEIFECYMCAGFWSGLLCGLLLIECGWITGICCGFAGSYVSNKAMHLQNYLEAATLGELENDTQDL